MHFALLMRDIAAHVGLGGHAGSSATHIAAVPSCLLSLRLLGLQRGAWLLWSNIKSPSALHVSMCGSS